MFFPAGESRSIHPVSPFLQERGDPRLGLAVVLWPFPYNLFPDGPEPRVIGVEIERPPHGSKKQAAYTRHPHHYTAVGLALRRAVAVDRAPEEAAVRAEEPAGRRVPFRKGEIHKDRPLVLVNFRSERGPGGDRFALERKRPGPAPDDDIIPKIHAARTALPAGKGHGYHVLSAPDDKKGTGLAE